MYILRGCMQFIIELCVIVGLMLLHVYQGQSNLRQILVIFFVHTTSHDDDDTDDDA